jgi:hypothetical protein
MSTSSRWSIPNAKQMKLFANLKSKAAANIDDKATHMCVNEQKELDLAISMRCSTDLLYLGYDE